MEQTFPNHIIEICVALDIAIFGIAYPIILDKVTNIGKSYSSEYIQVIFNSEFPIKSIKWDRIGFKISYINLISLSTVSSFIFLIFKIEPPFNWDNWFINNSANYLVLLLTIILLFSFIKLLNKLFLYNGASKILLNYLITEYNKIKSDPLKMDGNYFLRAINEIAIYAIENQDNHLQKTLLEFYYSEFTYVRRHHDKSEPLIYPIDLYFLVSKINEIVAKDEK